MPLLKKSTRAFTIIELLTVVAIIALLIAILLPSLAHARSRAKLAACASNLRQVMIGIATYAQEWNDRIPTAFRDDANSPHYYPFEGWFLTDNNNLYSTALLFAPRGLNTAGSGQIKDPRVFFCPAQVDTNFTWYGSDNSASWLQNSAGGANNGNPHMGYQYNLHVTPSGNNFPVLYRKLSLFPRNAHIMIDLLHTPDNVAHRESKGMASWNLSYSDGHVDPVRSSFVATWLNNNPNEITGSQQENAAIWLTIGGGGVKSLIDDLERRSGS